VSGENPRQTRDKPIHGTTAARAAPRAGTQAEVPGVADDSGSPPKKSTKATMILENLDAPVNLAPISNDRKPVTKKDEKKAGADQASALASEQAVRVESAASSGVSAVAGTSAKPAVRAPVAKAASLSEAVSAVKGAAKPTTSDQAAVELARAKPATQKPSDRAAPTGLKPSKASSAARLGFKPQEFIVYPAHGVGQIVTIEEQEVAGFKLELFVISFIKDKMILKVPTSKAAMVGMRKLAEADVVKKAFDTLGGRARVKRTMWSRRAQEYEAKINSGDLVAIAEVVRDLFRSDAQPEQSYSERQLYEAALDRMTREIIVVQKLTETEALRAIEAQLLKGPRRGGKAEEIDPDEADIEEAA
jgi:CarD family transcriptional regulator